MKYTYHLILLFIVLACTPMEEPLPLPDDCIFCGSIPDNGSADFAVGEISQQFESLKQIFEVSQASIVWIEDNVYSLKYWFLSGDCLEILIAEVNQDFNYHYPKPNTENQILEVFFNEQLMVLNNAALSLQPRPEDNGFHTVVNIHTQGLGNWNGTVNRVPFLN